MANFIGDWIFSDLTAYNITILRRDAAALFGQEALQGLYHLSIPMEMADMKYNRLSGVWISQRIYFLVKSLLLIIFKLCMWIMG
jgi:hypothetical protein